MVKYSINKKGSKNLPWVQQRSFLEKVFDFFLTIFMILVIFVTLFPLWSQLSLSLSSREQVVRNIFLLWPKDFTLASYRLSIGYRMLWSGYLNTIYRVLLAVPISVAATMLTAYPLSKKSLPFRRSLILIFLFTMLFNGGLIPNYLLINNLNLMNSIWSLVLPNAVAAYYILITRNFFMSLPSSLEESALIDGASVNYVFLKIVLPLSLPIVATIALFQLVWNWNAWFDSMIYIQETNRQVLQIILRRIVIQNRMDGMQALMSSVDDRRLYSIRQLQATIIILSTVPMLLIYPFVQKYFVKGIMIGAVKG